VGKMQAALRHPLDQVTVAELAAQISAHAQDDYLTVKMPPCKQLLNAPQPAHYAPLFSSKEHWTRLPASICNTAFAVINRSG
jgi:hypothetical protein